MTSARYVIADITRGLEKTAERAQLAKIRQQILFFTNFCKI
jgi:hypothetical protein